MRLRRPAVAALLGLLVAGALLRLWLTWRWRPAFLGFSDSHAYLYNASEGLFEDTLRPVGYPLFLRVVRQVSGDLTSTILLQHALGMASGAFAYLAGRRLGLGAWAALLPAAVLLLHGSTIWLEHAVLSESVFAFLLWSGVLVAALAVADSRPRVQIPLAGAAGLLLAAAGAVRTVGVGLVPLLVAWLAWAPAWPLRRRLAGAAVAAVAGLVLLGGNLVWAGRETGVYAFARHGYYQTYGRVGPFADCRRFDPPDGAEALCPREPPRDRPGPGHFVFAPQSPLVAAYGPVDSEAQPKDAADRTSAFVRAAILGQPGAYLEAVGRDLVRLVDPEFPLNPNPRVGNAGAGLTPADYQRELPGGTDWSKRNEAISTGWMARRYATKGIYAGDIEGLRRYEEVTRLTGVPAIALLLLALAGPLLATGRARRGAVLATGIAAALAIAPVLGHEYDWRYAVVALGPTALAAAFGVQGFVERARRASVSSARDD